MAEHKGVVLVIDDEEIMREVLDTVLTREGYAVRLASSGREGVEIARATPVDVALVDIMMPELDGIATLEELKGIDEELAVIIITAFASVESAIAAMKGGAFDYISKPFKNEEVLVVLRNALERRRLLHENRTLRQNLQERFHRFGNLVGRSPRMRQVFDLIVQAAPSRSPILVRGESGTGKELVARAIHSHSSRSERPFVVAKAAMAQETFGPTLLGYERDAVAGAPHAAKGLLDQAARGTLYIDEVSAVAPDVQESLLRLLEHREFTRVGASSAMHADVRLVASARDDLSALVGAGRFRDDLYHRLNVLVIELVPLRERREDIPLLVRHFVRKFADEHRKPDLELTPDAADMLMTYDWPGNVRELENAMERAVVLSSGGRIGVELLPEVVRRPAGARVSAVVVPPEGISFKDVTTDFEKRLIEATLEAAGGVQKRAAELLHIKPTTLNEMIKRYDIRPRRRAGPSESATDPESSEPAPSTEPVEG